MATELIDLVVFTAGERFFALESKDVREILDEQPVTRLPFVAPYIDGLVSVEGLISTQIDFAKYTSSTKADVTSHELIIINFEDNLYSIKIDKVVQKIEIDSDALRVLNTKKQKPGKAEIDSNLGLKEEPNNKGEPKIKRKDSKNDTGGLEQASLVKGEFEWDKKTVIFLDASKIAGLIEVDKAPEKQKGVLGKVKESHEEIEDDAEPYIILKGFSERFAFKLDQVVEVMPAEQITPIPGSPDTILGITVIREMPILVLSTSRLLDDERKIDLDSAHFVILSIGETKVALVFDSIIGIQPFTRHQYHASKLSSIKTNGVLIDDEQVLTTFLEPSLLIDEACVNQIEPYLPDADEGEQDREEETATMLQVLLDEELYAIPVESIKRITDYVTPGKLDKEHLASNQLPVVGITDLDGAVIPVVNVIGERFSKLEPSSFNGFVIFGDQNINMALSIEEARQLIEIPLSKIESFQDTEKDFISGIANFNQQLISIINVDPLISAQ